LPDAALAALGEARPRLQKAVAQQAKLKRTPQLSFAEDPAIVAGAKVEEILRAIQLEDEARGPAPDGGQEPPE
jgi:ribosome-binding factor A